MYQEGDRMVDRWKQLQDLAIGDRAMLPFQLLTKSAAGATLAPLTRNTADGTVAQTGSLQIATPAGTVTGAWTTDPRTQPVYVQQLGLAIGDLLQGLDGAITVCRATGLGPDGTWWSPYPDGHADQSQDGFQVIGHVSLP
jgi:hypothetical protein